ncbi:MAG: rhomboid family intramembrane serine protease [Pseudobdellovibrionaceae bacterium]|nr:rhomboid family intramembrane serine protease [Bdellovibrionales bacterium]USN46101.1 MAG: rhomboid family intramembrane serine protease [Pseudobdellovibrionaceae bacterium]
MRIVTYRQPIEHQRPKRRFKLVPLIVAINIVVFILWTTTATPRAENLMKMNFLVSALHLQLGLWWTAITSVFSHNMVWHLFLNMFVLVSFGTIMEKVMGRRSFMFFYLLAGIISSLSHCFVSTYFLDNPALPALGASGAIAGVLLVFSLVFPRQTILVFGLIPVPAIFGAMAFVALDLYGLFKQTQGGGLPIGHGAHLGGAFTGILYYFFYLRGHLRRRIMAQLARGELQ